MACAPVDQADHALHVASGVDGLARAKRELELRAARHVALPAEGAEAAGPRRVLHGRDVLAGRGAAAGPVHGARPVRADVVAGQRSSPASRRRSARATRCRASARRACPWARSPRARRRPPGLRARSKTISSLLVQALRGSSAPSNTRTSDEYPPRAEPRAGARRGGRNGHRDLGPRLVLVLARRRPTSAPCPREEPRARRSARCAPEDDVRGGRDGDPDAAGAVRR